MIVILGCYYGLGQEGFPSVDNSNVVLVNSGGLLFAAVSGLSPKLGRKLYYHPRSSELFRKNNFRGDAQ